MAVLHTLTNGSSWDTHQHFSAAPAHKHRTRINLPRTSPLFPPSGKQTVPLPWTAGRASAARFDALASAFFCQAHTPTPRYTQPK